MAYDASAALGAPQVAGCMVLRSGSAKRMAIGGLIGAALAARNAKHKLDDGTPNFGRTGYLAVTANDVALVKTKSGLWKAKLTNEVLARRPRNEVAAASLDGGMLQNTVNIKFSDGSAWKMEVPKARKGGAQQVIRQLSAAA
jgi:hypothetical protein